MGTGKNYIVEHFASKMHRPFFYFPCKRGMTVSDLGFHFEFRKGESYIVPSKLAEGLNTPNSVILIDEPNSLPPEVISGLHGLADHNRSFVYNGVEFKAAPGVVIAMAMNPATYAHVKSLPEAFSDRTLGQDMLMGYPPLTELDELAQKNLWTKAQREEALQANNQLNERYVCDEALILRSEFPGLAEMDEGLFKKLWNVAHNGESIDILESRHALAEAHREDLAVILRILKVCDLWRRRYQSGDMQRTISLRGSLAVAANYQRTRNVRKAFLDLYKPNSFKYDGGTDDYENLEQILNDRDELEIAINEALAA
jgi:MoxR-like ATPase